MKYIEKESFGYNPAIDGLRAIAVISVVGFHVGIKEMSGGFVGVDIFFVISGFLITGLLYRRIDLHSNLDLVGFYAKRFRRLFPSLFLTIFLTVVFCVLVMFPTELRRFGGSVSAASLAFSNHYFLRTTGGYFDPSVDYIPLLHTWSLGVEEQFYFVWPFILLFTARLSKNRNVDFLAAATVVLFIMAVVSYFSCYYFSYARQSYAFYLMPMRAWEFSIGGIAYAAADRLSVDLYKKNIIGACGLLLIFWSIGVLNESYVFPGVVSLVPCLGSALLLFAIGGSERDQVFVARLISFKPLVFVGLISYTFYLLHWPFLSIGRIFAMGEGSLTRDIFVALAALLVSIIVYFGWERPLRYSSNAFIRNNRSAILIGLSVVVVFWGGGRILIENGENVGGWVQSILYPNGDLRNLPSSSYRYPVDTKYCFQSVKDRDLRPYEKCSFGVSADKKPDILLWGDSHALHSIPFLNEIVRKQNLQVLVRASGGCPPIIGAIPFSKSGPNFDCANYNEIVMDDIKRMAKAGLKAVVLAARWNNCVGLPSVNAKDTDLCGLYLGRSDSSRDGLNNLVVGQRPLDAEGSRFAFRSSLLETVQKLEALGLRVLVISPVPEFSFQPQQCLMRNRVDDCRMPRVRVESRRALVIGVLNEIRDARDTVEIYDPIDQFCDANYCYVADQGGLFYSDDNHLLPDKSASMGILVREKFGGVLKNW